MVKRPKLSIFRMAIFFVVIFVAFFSLSRGDEPSTHAAFLEVRGPRNWIFPRDHGRHDRFKTEWWYFTGNLRDSGGRRFGYQLTFFRTALTAAPTSRPSQWGTRDLYFAHAAVSDIEGDRFYTHDRLERGREGLAWASDQELNVNLLDWTAQSEAKGIQLLAREKDMSIDLLCAGGRGPVLEGPGGVNAKGREPGQASYYYSMTRLQTTGTLTLAGRSYSVSGLSWMDHEFSSNALGKQQVGWDWMGMQLKDGTDLMIYRLRDSSGASDYLSGTKIGTDGKARYLSSNAIEISGMHPWKSPLTGGNYPQEWKLRVDGGEQLLVKSLMPGQELTTGNSTKVNYFEGAAAVLDARGNEVGEGYLEMTGYAKSLNSSF